MTTRRKRPGLFICSAALLAVAGGCNGPISGAATGSAIGALAGMGLGSLDGKMGEGAAAGAIIGAVGGAILGDQNARYSHGHYGYSGGHYRGHRHYGSRSRGYYRYDYCD